LCTLRLRSDASHDTNNTLKDLLARLGLRFPGDS
jgi:hypothetical protein